MPKLVVHGATLQCSCGTTPASLTVLPTEKTSADEIPAGTVDDYIPMTNIAPFGMCTTQANPQVAAATSAANGVLPPQPCLPVTSSAWTPGASLVTVNGKKALTDACLLSCQWSGSITITKAGTEIGVE